MQKSHKNYKINKVYFIFIPRNFPTCQYNNNTSSLIRGNNNHHHESSPIDKFYNRYKIEA